MTPRTDDRSGLALLERGGGRAELTSALEDLRHGTSAVALVQGEAGIGKTSLVRAYLGEMGDGVRVLVGGCDDLVVPRPLGPVFEAAETLVTTFTFRGHPVRDIVGGSMLFDLEDTPAVMRARDSFLAEAPEGGGYVNMLMDDEGQDRVEAAYGENFPRLVETKRRYDPENLWHVNKNIPS